jgi:hypothetical protein
MPARPHAPVAAGALLLVALTGCEKPTPGVTLSSGTQSVHMEATTFCRDGQTPAKQDCVEHLSRVAEITVKQGNQVSVDVDRTIAEHGWILVLPAGNQRSDVQDEHHFAYTPDFSAGPFIDLEVRSLDRVADDAQTTGIWKFRLRQG